MGIKLPGDWVTRDWSPDPTTAEYVAWALLIGYVLWGGF